MRLLHIYLGVVNPIHGRYSPEGQAYGVALIGGAPGGGKGMEGGGDPSID